MRAVLDIYDFDTLQDELIETHDDDDNENEDSLDINNLVIYQDTVEVTRVEEHAYEADDPPGLSTSTLDMSSNNMKSKHHGNKVAADRKGRWWKWWRIVS